MPEEQKMWTVSEVNRLVKDVLEQSFYPFWVQGEIGNITIHRSGHVYLTLKDNRSLLSGVYFRGASDVRSLELQSGAKVEAYGRLGVYEPRGVYQLVISRIRPMGKGDLQRLFEELKRKLRAEGLFDEERKRPIPVLPRSIGVVTSPQGAAIRDFLNVLARRFANLNVRIYPAAVQGEGAAAQIAEGIEFFSRSKACDVIVVTRGGGSLEDLWAFNEEVLARAVAASEVPVISAVGHEVDFTICDFVADLRVPTPSAAAELVIGRKADLQEKLQTFEQRIRNALKLRLGELKRRVERAAGSYVFREPANVVRASQQRVDELIARMVDRTDRKNELAKHRLSQIKQQLQALNPHSVLERGYAILLNTEQEAVTDADEVKPGQRLHGVLARGTLELDVTHVHKGKQLEVKDDD